MSLLITPLTLTVKDKYTQQCVFIFDCLGGYREGETPGPIPNPEAKPLIADNTAPFRCGNVGRCLVDRLNSFLFNQSLILTTFIITSYNSINFI